MMGQRGRLPRILGVIAMIDDDETDWKVLTIALDDDKARPLGFQTSW